jgi:hypothetical protein
METAMILLTANRFNGSGMRRKAAATVIALTTILSLSSAVRAEDDAAQILKAMSDYVSGQQSISLTFNSDIEVITPEIQGVAVVFLSMNGAKLITGETLYIDGGYHIID